MVKAVDIQKEIAKRPFLRGRNAATESQAAEAFATLAAFNNGAIFAGGFSGETPWERHRNGDELVQVMIEIPKKLSSEQNALLREFADTEDEQILPESKGFFTRLMDYLSGAKDQDH